MNSEFVETSGQKVLCADLSAVDSELISIFIRSQCRQIIRERNGLSVVDKVGESINENAPFDLVFLNKNLVDLDGIEVTKRIRQEGFEGTIIGISVDNSSELRQEWSSFGCDEFLEKPISRTKVLELLRQISSKL